MDEQQRQPRARDYLALLRRRRWLMIGTFLLIVGAVAVGTFLQQPTYRATVSLLIETRQPGLGRLAELPVLAEVLQPIAAKSAETQKQLIKSRVVLAQTLQRAAPQMELEEFTDAVSIQTSRDTDVLEVTVDHHDPQLAQRLANTLAEVYVKQNQEWNRESTTIAGASIEERLKTVHRQLTQSEEALRKYKQQHGIVDLDEESKMHIKILGDLEGAKATSEAEVRPLEARLEVVNKALSGQEKVLVSATDIERKPVIAQLESRLAVLEGSRAAELATHTEETEKAKELSAEIEDLRKQLATEVATVVARETRSVNTLHQDFLQSVTQTTAAYLATKARVKGLGSAIRQHEAALTGVPTEQVELARLTRDVTIDGSIYTSLVQKLDDVRITEAMRQASARIVDPAIVPTEPVKPRKVLNLTLAVVLGMVVGLTLAALAEYLDDTLKTSEEIKQRIGLPVLGHVPLIREAKRPLITELTGRSPFAESYHTLRHNLAFAALDQPFKTLLVTSPLPQEGKSVTAVNLAVAFALDGKKVILVDSDLRNPTLHRLLGRSKSPGLTDVLVDNVPLSEVIKPTDTQGLSVVPAGTSASNPAVLLGSQKASQVIKDLSEEADVVVFDSPPLLVSADPAVLAAGVDATVVVCAADTVREHSAVQAKEQLQMAKARILGIALNKVRSDRGSCYHHYYYGGDGPAKGNARRKRK